MIFPIDECVQMYEFQSSAYVSTKINTNEGVCLGLLKLQMNDIAGFPKKARKHNGLDIDD